MDTNFKFWITSLISSDESFGDLEFQALKFDRFAGFGRNPSPYYKGKVLCLTAEGELYTSALVERRHAVRRGFYYVIACKEAVNLPMVPFLLTSETATKVIYHGRVMIKLDAHQIEFVDSTDTDEWFSIGTENWFGVAQKSKREGLFNLLAFGIDNLNCVAARQALIEMDTGMKFGEIISVGINK